MQRTAAQRCRYFAEFKAAFLLVELWARCAGRMNRAFEQGYGQHNNYYGGQRPPVLPGGTGYKQQWQEGNDVGQDRKGDGLAHITGRRRWRRQ
ncbi:MAG: hypothetical protein U5J63_02970 [Fodinibius sp.]|nr:hypothetical protein [Fodinibius sp.]